jgi:hypothetical protein
LDEGWGMLNISEKTGEAKESMILKTRKCTPSLDCRITSALGSLNGAFANVSWGGANVVDMMEIN